MCVCVVNEILSHTGTINIIGTNIKSTKKKRNDLFPIIINLSYLEYCVREIKDYFDITLFNKSDAFEQGQEGQW